jgi:predicted RNA-binding Zn-ribbon protein involved in translation (DUF1610 family)
MSDFNFRCPKCSHKGSNKELKCYNCDGVLELLETKSGTVVACPNCGLDQMGSCSRCDALITLKCVENPLYHWVKYIGYGFLIFLIYVVLWESYIFIEDRLTAFFNLSLSNKLKIAFLVLFVISLVYGVIKYFRPSKKDVVTKNKKIKATKKK